MIPAFSDDAQNAPRVGFECLGPKNLNTATQGFGKIGPSFRSDIEARTAHDRSVLLKRILGHLFALHHSKLVLCFNFEEDNVCLMQRTANADQRLYSLLPIWQK
jgi:hypothetical protein